MGTVVAAVSILAAVGSWIKATRHQAVLADSAVSSRRYHVDSASEPGPSKHMHKLVRQNPEAAASVLQRWTGQGGRPDDVNPTRCFSTSFARSTSADYESKESHVIDEATISSSGSWTGDLQDGASAIAPVKKAAIVLVSLDQSLASQLLSHLDRATSRR